ncbi:cupin domain-containing protein, partial [Calothrix rhizosoleniae]|uniref:cupin domain-containing protein n=1 Tax=Calothrix rhizosoleniae TaxID=888997 RepID=UPI000B49C940
MKILNKILHPYSLESFLAENWAKQGIVIPGKHTDKFQHLFSWQHLNHLLNYHQPELRFVKNGQILPPCPPQEWSKLCREGASLTIHHVHNHFPALADLTWEIQEELGHSAIHANVYCSWPSRQAFDIHYDAHEVLIMQIHGQKEWFVFKDTFKYPYRDEKSERHKPPEGEPYIHTVLKPGDLLYIPRGHWHYAIASEEPSLHVTLGIRCFTGQDVLEWLLDKVQKNLQKEETWRQNLPLIPYGNTDDIESYTGHLFDSLITVLNEEKKSLVHKFAMSQV